MKETIGRLFHYTIGPLIVMLTTPLTTVLLAYCVCKHNGSLISLWEEMQSLGVIQVIQQQWVNNMFGTAKCWQIIGVISLLQLVLMRILPGPEYEGPVAPNGHVPKYRENGIWAYLVTCILFFGCSSYGLNLFPASIIIDEYQNLVITLVYFGIVFCAVLYAKGILYPSTVEHGQSGNSVFDFYWGTELYPRILGWDVKVFTNCRFGLMLWQLSIFSGLAYQQNTFGEISYAYIATAVIQTQYIFKFYIWEKAYTKSMDIAWDRAGFYICWGCIAFVIVGFNTPTIYLALHNVEISYWYCVACIIAGVFFTWLTYWADMQKEITREKEGKCLVFGKKADIMWAKYTVGDEEERQNILLLNGFWGWARQFHCVLELLASLAWSLPALFNTFYPWIYLLTLWLIVIQHIIRDEWKCKEKYGVYWDEYSKRVPYRLIPYVF